MLPLPARHCFNDFTGTSHVSSPAVDLTPHIWAYYTKKTGETGQGEI